jgi:hypothetical protein
LTKTTDEDREETAARELRLWLEDPPDDDVQKRWLEYHRRNPKVYALLVRFTREAFKAAEARGRDLKRYGIQAVAERARWFVFFETDDAEDFKLPNEFLSRYARQIMTCEPDLRSAFELRTLRPVIHPNNNNQPSKELSTNGNNDGTAGRLEEVGK